jgi:hypothetical protein
MQQFVWTEWQGLVKERLGEIAVLRRTINHSGRFWAHLECRGGCHWTCSRVIKPNNAVVAKLSDVPETHRPILTEIFYTVGAKALHMMGGSKFLLELPAPGRICYLLFEPRIEEV